MSKTIDWNDPQSLLFSSGNVSLDARNVQIDITLDITLDINKYLERERERELRLNDMHPKQSGAYPYPTSIHPSSTAVTFETPPPRGSYGHQS